MFAGTQFGRYEIRSKIGEGGMGEVYSAHDLELDRDVAIKLLPNEFVVDEDRRGRFKQEARVVSALNHPNIITIYEIGESEYGSFLATEFVEGKTLREVMKSESITLPRILRIIEQAANALVAAHAANIVHRDIKPENIMVRSDSIVKVLDFGLAKPVMQLGTIDQTTSNKTIPGTVMGSARYMSPEQARGREVDERTDVWSLGVVLYELLTGRPPFEGESTADTLAAVIYHEPAPLAHILPNAPFELQRIVRKALQKDRDERYQDIKDFALDIKELIYALDHANSGDRSGNVISDPSFSENPTMIHRTVSGNHPTSINGAYISAPNVHSAAVPTRRRAIALLAAGAAIALSVIAGASFYGWFSSDPAFATDAFEKPAISRINTDGRVMLPAISPDGKYVAYVSGELGSRSLVVRQIATDSTLTVVPPTNLNLQSVTFSPSGDHVYYTQMNSDFTVSTLYQVPSLGGPSKKVIEDVDGTVSFAPNGSRFAFVRHVPKTNEDLVMIVDAETLEAVPLISTKETNHDFFVYRVAWSPDGDTLLTGAGRKRSGFVNGTDIVTINVNDKNVRTVNRQEFFTAANFAWFPDGSGFVFTGRQDQNDPSQVWRAEYPTGELHRVTNDLNEYVDLGITDDGRSLITTKGDTTGSIWRYSIADKSTVQITSDSRNVEGKAGIIDDGGNSLIYTRLDGKAGSLWRSDRDGKNGKALIQESGYIVEPVKTRDGDHIIFNLQRDRRSRIFKASSDGSTVVALSPDDEHVSDMSPQLIGDGKMLIFQRQAPDDERFKLMRMPVDGGPAEVFFEDPERGIFAPRVSPDGKRIAFSSYDLATFGKTLHIATIEDGKIGKIERNIEFNLINAYAWTPDSRELTILTNRGGAQNLWRQPIDGSQATAITDFKSGRIFNFAWANNGKELLIARGNVNNDLIMIRDTAARQTAKLPSREPSIRRNDGASVFVPRLF
jgi:serine/threonine protein kinase